MAADRAKAALSGLFAWSIDRGYLDLNPVQNIKRRAGTSRRNRVLSEAELVAIWKVCGEDDYGRIVRLLILTGQRRDGIGGLTWTEFIHDKRLLALPSPRTKNGDRHRATER